MVSIAGPGDDATRTTEMHPYLTGHLVQDHHATLEREARQHALAKAAIATRKGRAEDAPGSSWFMPHVQERGRLRRVIAALLRPSPA